MIQIEIITPEGRQKFEVPAGMNAQFVAEIRLCMYCDEPLFVIPDRGQPKRFCSDTHRKMYRRKNRE